MPTTAKTEAGFYLKVDPVEVVSVDDTKGFEQALKRVIERGNPRIPTPTREELSRMSGVEKYAKLKSWPTFAKSASAWSIKELDGIYTVAPLKDAPGKPFKGHPGWVIDSERTESFPPGSTIEEVVKRTVERVQAAQRK